MRLIAAMIVLAVAFLPTVAAHGALELNEFDTYAISDFEGLEDSFPHEGFEIWDIYAGDGYFGPNESHGVYFKGNFAGDGTVRPAGGQEWTLRFTFNVAGIAYERTIVHDGAEVTSDFEQLEWQIADGNVFQVHAWVPVPAWEGHTISELVVLSSVDGDPRDIAPGGIYDPASGEEIPVSGPPTPVFPALGEGRIVDEVVLTGAAKFLDVSVAGADGLFTFTVNNPLAAQGQHLMVDVLAPANWTIGGQPNAQSLAGGGDTAFVLDVKHAKTGTVAPVRVDLLTDIGGLQSWFIYLDATGLHVVNDEALATPYTFEAPAQESPGLPLLAVMGVLALLAGRRR